MATITYNTNVAGTQAGNQQAQGFLTRLFLAVSRARTRRALLELSPRQLSDIGINSREDLERAVASIGR